MKLEPILEEHYGTLVWTNKTTDSIRRDECLCLYCDLMKYNKEDNCNIAQRFYEICIDKDIAFMMTRCKQFVLKKNIKGR